MSEACYGARHWAGAPNPGRCAESGQVPETGTRPCPKLDRDPARNPGTEGAQRRGTEKGHKNARAGARPASDRKKPGASVERRKPAGDHQKFIDYFTERWQERHGTKYHFEKGKDGAAAKYILKESGNLAQAKRVVDTYLACSEPFFVKARHPLAVLRSQFNRFNADVAGGNGQASITDVDFEPVEPSPDVLAMLAEPPRPGEPGHPDTIPLGAPTRKAATA